MQELVGRLTTLDPAASESLKVIAYFDALVEARAGRLSLLRAAARLAGCPAGCRLVGEPAALRVSPEGHRLPDAPATGWPGRGLTGGGRVWLERGEVQHPAEPMILERLALAMSLADGRSAPPAAHVAAALVDALASPEERADAAERLRLGEHDQVRAVALPLPGPAREGLTTVATPWGPVRLVLLRGDGVAPTGPAGVGFAVRPAELPASWSSALVALRARRPGEEVTYADALGALVVLVQAMDAGAPVPADVLRVQELRADHGTARTLDALADAPSLRAAAGSLGLHHSTLQAKVDHLGHALGFELTSPHGRTRLDLALALARVRQATFAS